MKGVQQLLTTGTRNSLIQFLRPGVIHVIGASRLRTRHIFHKLNSTQHNGGKINGTKKEVFEKLRQEKFPAARIEE